MNAPHLLICVEKPIHHKNDQKVDGMSEWLRFLNACSDAQLNFQKAETPCENIWLIPVESGLLRASRLIALCAQHHIPCKSFYLSHAPTPCV
jgi:hypothetical protein